jgi:hypothetical protein
LASISACGAITFFAEAAEVKVLHISQALGLPPAYNIQTQKKKEKGKMEKAKAHCSKSFQVVYSIHVI